MLFVPDVVRLKVLVVAGLSLLVFPTSGWARFQGPGYRAKAPERTTERAAAKLQRPIFLHHLLKRNVSSTRVFKTTKKEPASEKILFGSLSLCPTIKQEGGAFFVENNAELGLNVSPDVGLSYGQDFNIGQPEPDAGYSPVIKDGSVKLGLNNLWVSEDKTLNFGDDIRAYFPTDETKRNAGMMIILSNTFRLSQKMSDSVQFSFKETPILHVYESAGSVDAKGQWAANPVFENQLVFEISFGFSQSVKFVLPLKYYTTKYGDYEPSAKLNDAWSYYLGVSPALVFTLGSEMSLGIKYNSSSFAEDTDDGLTLGDGFSKGSFQMSLNISL